MTVIKPIFGFIGMVYAMLSIALLGFIVWSHVVGHAIFDRFINFAIYRNSLRLVSSLKTGKLQEKEGAGWGSSEHSICRQQN